MRTPVLSTILGHLDTITDFLRSDLSPTRDYPIVVHKCEQYPEKYIMFNSEQLSRQDQLKNLIAEAAREGCVEVWDYSAANVSILAANGVVARHLPLQCSESYLSRLRAYRAEGQIYDFGFCGAISRRRAAFINAFMMKGVRVHIVKSFGEERDRELAKCRVLLNFHYADDYKIFESARCEPWVTIGVPVISEHSIDNDPRCINVSRDEFVNKSLDFIKALNTPHTA